MSLSKHEVPRDLGCCVRSGDLGDGACCVTECTVPVNASAPVTQAQVPSSFSAIVISSRSSSLRRPRWRYLPVDRGEDNLVTSKTKAPAK